MKYRITYEVPIAYGHTRTACAVAYTRKEMVELVQVIEKVGYKLTDLNYDDSEYGISSRH